MNRFKAILSIVVVLISLTGIVPVQVVILVG